jgi:hypothetical protein
VLRHRNEDSPAYLTLIQAVETGKKLLAKALDMATTEAQPPTIKALHWTSLNLINILGCFNDYWLGIECTRIVAFRKYIAI